MKRKNGLVGILTASPKNAIGPHAPVGHKWTYIGIELWREPGQGDRFMRLPSSVPIESHDDDAAAAEDFRVQTVYLLRSNGMEEDTCRMSSMLT
jgi:hypothetical protein